jgi:hypothetical protein
MMVYARGLKGWELVMMAFKSVESISQTSCILVNREPTDQDMRQTRLQPVLWRVIETHAEFHDEVYLGTEKVGVFV